MNLDQFLSNKYSSYIAEDIKKCVKDISELMKELKQEKKKLNKKDIDKIIKKITYGKRNCILTVTVDRIYVGLQIINLLTIEHLLDNKQVERIIDCLPNGSNNFDWINNLKNLGYEFDKNELLLLSKKGYQNTLDHVLQKGDLDIQYMNKFIVEMNKGYEKCKYENCLQLYKKYQIIPNDDTLKIIFKMDISGINLYTKLKNMQNLGYILNKGTYDIVLNFLKESNYYASNYSIDSNYYVFMECLMYVDNLLSIYTDIFSLSKCNSKYNQLVILVTTELIKKNIIPTLEDIKNLIKLNGGDRDENLEKLYNIFFSVLKIVPDQNFCDYLCIMSDVGLVKYLCSKNLFAVSNNSLLNSCKSNPRSLIEEMINLKCVPTLDCIKVLKILDSFILELLILGGLPVTHQLLSECYKKDKYILPNIYGLSYDEELYYEFYKTFGGNIFPSQYFDNYNKSKFNFRLLFKKEKLEVIKEQMQLLNLHPDQYCMDYSLKNYNTDVTEWLEKTYNFKPNYLTLISSQSIEFGEYIMEKYIRTNKFDHNTDYKNIYLDINK